MLKGIPSILTPELLKLLSEMGHGDEIVIADGNFAAETLAQRLVRLDGNNVPEILDAILKFFPLDPSVEAPVTLMAKVEGDTAETKIWDEFKEIVNKYNPDTKIEFEERFDFYDRTKKAFAVIATTEMKLYANIILKKGLVVE
ncbi:MAG: fucose isomerase [Clostridia bacterium]|nr:fucose isomerase [Clostridia bacterium]